MIETILVLDYGSQFNQLICRRIREIGVYSELLPHDVSFEKIKSMNPKGIILSGGPASVYDKKAPKLPPWIFDARVPVLGICYGMQLLTKMLGGTVTASKRHEYGLSQISLTMDSPLFHGIHGGNCWMSHGDDVTTAPPGFVVWAKSVSGAVAAIGDEAKKIFAVQFHPEVSHTPFGSELLKNFLKLCGCHFSWTMKTFIEETVKSLEAKIGGQKAICGVSGGVDSTVAAALVSKAIGKNLHSVFVDNGLLRQNERQEVRTLLSQFPMNLHVIDATQDFLGALRGVIDPERKRKIIGKTFIRIFEKKARQLKNIDFLVQGTLYPDVIESATSESKLASKIKTHHNVGGLPKKMRFKLIEPLRHLFKDEVRKLGAELGIPSPALMRQPFPGPGLAVRILGDIKKERLDLLRRADSIVREEILKSPAALSLWQFFAVLLPLKTVGVMGDGRTYQNVVALRAVESADGMTADWARLPWDVLTRVSSRIVSEVRGINRVVYDITSKPPATIEWE